MMMITMMAKMIERFKGKIIEGLRRKNEFLKNEIQNDDDLKVIHVTKANRN